MIPTIGEVLVAEATVMRMDAVGLSEHLQACAKRANELNELAAEALIMDAYDLLGREEEITTSDERDLIEQDYRERLRNVGALR